MQAAQSTPISPKGKAMNKAPMGADMMSRIYHNQRGGAPMHQQPMQGGMQQPMQQPMQGQPTQGGPDRVGFGPGVMGQFIGQMMGKPQVQSQRPYIGQGYNAAGSGAMNAIIAQLMQRGR